MACVGHRAAKTLLDPRAQVIRTHAHVWPLERPMCRAARICTRALQMLSFRSPSLQLNPPMNPRAVFYQNALAHFIKDRDSSILVCAGGQLDKEVFQHAGFTNVTISN